MYGMDPTLQASNALYNSVSSRQAMFPWALNYGPMAGVADPTDSVALTPLPTLPADITPSEMSTYFDKVRRMKQRAIEAAIQQGYRPRPAETTRPTGSDTTSKAGGPLDVRAHAYYEGEKMIAVKDVRIWEVNNYRNRTWNSFSGDWQEQDLSLGKTTVGKYYRVQVTWANGVSEERDVRMDNPNGQTLDFYHY